MEKPFNPILGETYQGTIDGCPVSLEQISHHPPIAAYLLKGRGYKMHGIIQSKASLGLNCAKGSSPFPNYIEFEDGVEIEFGISQMVINGLLFGERSFNFEGISTFLLNQIMSSTEKIKSEPNLYMDLQKNPSSRKVKFPMMQLEATLLKSSPGKVALSSPSIKDKNFLQLMVFGIPKSKLTSNMPLIFELTFLLPSETLSNPFSLILGTAQT